MLSSINATSSVGFKFNQKQASPKAPVADAMRKNTSKREERNYQTISFILGAVTAMSATLLGALIATRGKLFKQAQDVVKVVEKQVEKEVAKAPKKTPKTQKLEAEKVVENVVENIVETASIATPKPKAPQSFAEAIENLIKEKAGEITEKIIDTPSGRKLKIVEINGEKLKEVYFKGNSTEMIAFEDFFKNNEVFERIYYRDGKSAWYKTIFQKGEEIKRINFLDDGRTVDFSEIKINGEWVREIIPEAEKISNAAEKNTPELLDYETIRRELKDYLVD